MTATMIWHGAVAPDTVEADVSDRDELAILSPPPRPARMARGTQPVLGEEDTCRFGPYWMRERIGAGGMGAVHRAEIETADGERRSVAIKQLWPHLAGDRQALAAFAHEAALGMRLCHEHIAQTTGSGELHGTRYLEMEYVDGWTLEALMRHGYELGEPIPIRIAVELLIQLLAALQYLHGACDDDGRSLRVVHRDVSPNNLIVSRAGCLKLIDFGIARTTTSPRETRAGIVKGKVAYLAPEYLGGQLDPRADLFAVGVIAYELLTGRPLFRGDSDLETLIQIRDKPISRPSRYRPEIPRELDEIVMLALAREPARRWQTAAAMQIALRALADTRADRAQIAAWAAWLTDPSTTGEQPAPRGDDDDDWHIAIARVATTQSAPVPIPDPVVEDVVPLARSRVSIAVVLCALVIAIVTTMVVRLGSEAAPSVAHVSVQD